MQRKRSKIRRRRPTARPQTTSPRRGLTLGFGILTALLLAASMVILLLPSNPRATRETTHQPVTSATPSIEPEIVQQPDWHPVLDPAAPPDEQAALWMAAGNERLTARDPAGATEAYRAAVTLTPEDEDAYYNLGVALAAQGDFDDAIAAYQKALELFPDYPEVHNNLGNALGITGNLPEALNHLDTATELWPEYATAHNNRGTVLQRLGRSEEAIEAFATAAKLEPDYLEASFNLGRAYLVQGQPDKAEPLLQRVLELQPGFTPAIEALARAREQLSSPSPAP
jgi:tetratricopeptide (TPR) repeat protein